MSQRWYYQRGGQTHGPVSADELHELVSHWQLGPTDLVWPEWETTASAVPAKEVMPFSFQQPPPEAKAAPDWLEELRATAHEPPPPPRALPDWLDDVRQSQTAPPEAPPAPEGQPPPPAPRKRRKSRRPRPSVPVAPAVPLAQPVYPSPAPLPLADPTPRPGPCRLAVGSATSAGRVRASNEDSFVVLQASGANLDRGHEAAVAVVADGMGGHRAGDRASGLVIEVMGTALAALLGEALRGRLTQDAAGTALDRAFREAHRAVAEAAGADAACAGMGATAVALAAWDGQARIGLVGDGRVYHQRGGRLSRVTREQTVVARMVERGELSPEEADVHPRRHEVLQAVGDGSALDPAYYELELIPGDWVIVACDGLSAHVEDPAIQEAIAQAAPSPAALARRLVEMADRGGGSDDCTVVAVYGY